LTGNFKEDKKYTNRPAGRSLKVLLAETYRTTAFSSGRLRIMFRNDRTGRKKQVCQVAVDVFFEKGYTEASLHDIAARANISKAGIYHYFKTKSEILSCILLGLTEEGFGLVAETVTKAKSEKQDQQDVVAALIKAYAFNILKNQRISLLILRERDQLTPHHRKELLKKERTVFEMVRNELAALPELKTHFNINVITFQVISTIHWMGYWYDPEGLLSVNDVLDQMIETILTGILQNEKTE
jgi:TetR/AcrR family transcriptional regulator, cholesterol catabolism regulator